MQKFSQKYAIIQLFEELPVGTRFAADQWPLHATIADAFAANWEASRLVSKLSRY